MARAKGRVLKLDPVQVAGTDTKVWQSDGTATDTLGVVFTQRGEVEKVAGIRMMNPHGVFFGGKDGTGKFTLESPVLSVGCFSKDGYSQLILEAYWDLDGAIDTPASKLYIYESGGWVSLDSPVNPATPYIRTRSAKKREATQFVQVGNILLILNGRDGNMKWDGVKLTPLGISASPSPPTIVESTQGEGDVSVYAANHDGSAFVATSGIFAKQMSIACDGSLIQNYTYRTTWYNDQGQESEASLNSNRVDDRDVPNEATYNILVANLSDDPPSDDIVGRNLYRSTDFGITFYYIASLPGCSTDTYWDYTDPTAVIQTTLAKSGTNLAPPLSKWAIHFKGRTYYGGNPDAPLVLYYSNPNSPESVGSDNLIFLSSDMSGDELTGGVVGGDYALVFTKRSTHMLTQDRSGNPILSPMSMAVGAVAPGAIVGFEEKVFFVGRDGLYAFNGSRVTALSREISTQFDQLPKEFIEDAFGWADVGSRRVCFSFVSGTSTKHNEVWIIHVDTGALSKVSMSVSAAVAMRGEHVVSYSPQTNPSSATTASIAISSDVVDPSENLIGIWDAAESIETDGTYYGRRIVYSYPGVFETRWLTGDNPQSDKTYYRVDVFYVQTGTKVLMEWSTDWENDYFGKASIDLADPDALKWGEAGSTGAITQWQEVTKSWDSARVRCKQVALKVNFDAAVVSAYQSGQPLTGKSLKLRFSANGADDKFKIVGFLLHYSDHGVRGEGTDAPTS